MSCPRRHPMFAAPIVALLVPLVVAAQDAATVQLQQDVLELRRVNQQLEQRIGQLERQVAGQSGLAVPPIASSPPGGLASPAGVSAAGTNPAAGTVPRLPWLETANWDRIRAGMPELEVIRILGVPNSVRDAGAGGLTVFYAIEIGTGRFLSGSVSLADHHVTDVQKPTLK